MHFTEVWFVYIQQQGYTEGGNVQTFIHCFVHFICSLDIVLVTARPHSSNIIQIHQETEELGNTLGKLPLYFLLQQDTTTSPDKVY